MVSRLKYFKQVVIIHNIYSRINKFSVFFRRRESDDTFKSSKKESHDSLCGDWAAERGRGEKRGGEGDRVRAETRNESLEHDPATRKRKYSQSIFEIAIQYRGMRY